MRLNVHVCTTCKALFADKVIECSVCHSASIVHGSAFSAVVGRTAGNQPNNPVCLLCGVSITHLHGTARYCSVKHRARAAALYAADPTKFAKYQPTDPRQDLVLVHALRRTYTQLNDALKPPTYRLGKAWTTMRDVTNLVMHADMQAHGEAGFVDFANIIRNDHTTAMPKYLHWRSIQPWGGTVTPHLLLAIACYPGGEYEKAVRISREDAAPYELPDAYAHLLNRAAKVDVSYMLIDNHAAAQDLKEAETTLPAEPEEPGLECVCSLCDARFRSIVQLDICRACMEA